MKVVDHEPYAWFLFGEGDTLLLDVNCSHGAAGYSVMIELDPAEKLRYAAEGRGYVDELARSVQNSGPGRGLQSRDVSRSHSGAVSAAVSAWRATQETP